MKKTITTIIVDDESNSIATLSKDLENYPEIQIIETTTSVEKAKKIIVQHQPDLLFLDIEMPKMNGREAAQEIRKLKKGKDIPIIAFTAYAIKAEKEKCMAAGMNDYISKPYKLDKLIEIIKKYDKKTTEET